MKKTLLLLFFTPLFLIYSCKVEVPEAIAMPDPPSSGGPEMATPDARLVENGTIFFDNGYVDQPYVEILPDGRWFCCLTTGKKGEGSDGQQIVYAFSSDQGKHWTKPVPLETDLSKSASWATPYRTNYNRLYVFYVYNGDGISHLNGGPIRNDMLGWYCYRYSDDNGATWSDRYRIPIRKTKVDLENDWKGQVQMLWGISKPIRTSAGMMFAFTKIGKFLIDKTEGWIINSPNIDQERDPTKLTWKLLPEGDEGIRAPKLGSVQEEQNLVQLSDGSLYCVYRTTMGHPAFAISRDQGNSWPTPTPIAFQTGNLVKHPRACPRIWKCSNGKYLLWFHNIATRDFQNRNPVWIAGGVEKNGTIEWGQPEILLYSKTISNRYSYPDLVERNGHYWITETQKEVARLHDIDTTLLNGLWNQQAHRVLTTRKLLWADSNIPDEGKAVTHTFKLPDLKQNGSFSIELRVRMDAFTEGQILLDTRLADSDPPQGMVVKAHADQTLSLEVLGNGHALTLPTDAGLLKPGQWHSVVFVVDGSPNIGTVYVDGRLCDGGAKKPTGWVRFNPELADINGSSTWQLMPQGGGRLGTIRLYNRYLRTAEVIANYQSEK